MASKRPKSAETDRRAGIVAAALALAAKRDWANVTLADIARAAKVKLADVAARFDSREDIVAAYGRCVDARMLNDYPNGVPGGSDKDKLFEILMARFDILNEERAALTSILRAACADPKQMVIGLPGVAKSMAWTLEACRIDTNGWKGAVRVAGLSAAYLWCLRTWKEDDSADMAKTMAALDRVLDRMGSVSDTIGL